MIGVPPQEKLSGSSTSGEGPLVGRVRELGELCATYASTRGGHGGVHVILGDPGVGKTRLAAALAEHAQEDGAVVVWTRGWGRATPAYWPWVEVVRSLCHGVDGQTLRAELGRSADELLRLVPELARLPDARPAPDRPAAGDEAGESARFALFDALASLLRWRAAAAPVLVLIDDLQVVDEDSLIALDFVSRTLRDAAVMLVLTMHERPPERSEGAQAALSNIVRAGRRLFLGGLSSDDVGRMIALTSGVDPAPRLARAVHARTEGNAFFAREILALLLAEGRLEDPPDDLPLPDGVRETIRRRLEPLDERAIQTLGLAAVFGKTFELTALQRASVLDREQVLAALDGAARLGIVAELAGRVGRYRFGHGLIGETLLASMTPTARREAHGAAGGALEHVYRGAIESHLPELAHHFLSAAPRGDMHKAVDYAQRAAQRDLDNLAYEHAAELFGRALQALELLEADPRRRAALLLGQGTAQSRAGRAAARASFDAASAIARNIGERRTLALAALGAAPFALAPGFVDETHVALLVEALEHIGPGDDPLRVRLLGSLATALYWSDTAERRCDLAQEALAMARRLGDDVTLAYALSAAQLVTSGPDSTRQGVQWLQALFEHTERAGESMQSLDARGRHIDLLIELDDLVGADIAIETAERLATAARDRQAIAFARLQRGRRLTIEGRFGEARRVIAEVAALRDEMPATTVPLTVDAQLAVLDWIQRGPREIVEQVRAYADRVPAMPVWRAALAAALADDGRGAEAELELERLAADDFAALPRDSLWLCAMAALAEAVATLGLRSRALELYPRLEPYRDRNVVTPTSAFLGPVELWLGILARVGGLQERTLEHLGQARIMARRNGDRVSLARIAIEEATALVDLGAPWSLARAGELVEWAGTECEDMDYSSMLAKIAQLGERIDGGSLKPAAARPAGGEATATLRRVGEAWMVDDGASTLYLNDSRGVRLLACLLQRPGHEVHSLDLVAIIDGTPGSSVPDGGQQTSTRAEIQTGAGPRLDAQAKTAYRARVDDLGGRLAEAQARGDAQLASRLEAELAFVSRELELAVGIGGRDRSESGSHAERARVSVTRAIRGTIKRIAGYDSRLGGELEHSIRTGTFCAYEPDRRRPTCWSVQDSGR